MLEWLIIGGGVHGVHIALSLIGGGRVQRERIRILDPAQRLLERWDQCTRNTGMSFLRSPLVHHLGIDPFDLHNFSCTPHGKPFAHFTPPYDRPSLDLFRKHCEHLTATSRLDDIHIQEKALRISEIKGGIRVETDAGGFEAKRIALAVGLSDQPHWPDWAKSLKAAGCAVNHIFDAGFDRETMPSWKQAVVIGGGITAVQTAIALSNQQPGAVALISPHEPKIHQFDSDPGWLGPKHMRTFEGVHSMNVRRTMIREARHRGSIPQDILNELTHVTETGMLDVSIARILSAQKGESMSATLTRSDPFGAITADKIILATGFDAKRPGGALIDAAVSEMGLTCAECGYPIVDRFLRWHPRMYVTGPLAELELGPAARNIAGARRAADRLVRAA